MAKPVRKAVLPVAGMGTRFLPATRAVSKEMLPVVDKPLIQYAVEEARAAGIERFIFVTGRGEAAIERHFGRDEELDLYLAARGDEDTRRRAASAVLAPGATSFTRQQKPLGLGHAVLCARDLVGDEPFAVLLPDELLLGDPPLPRVPRRASRPHGRERGGARRGAGARDRPLRHRRGRGGGRASPHALGHGGEAPAGPGAVATCDHRPLRAATRGLYAACGAGAGRGAARYSSPTPWPRWPGRRRFAVCATGAGASIAEARPGFFRRRSPAPWKGRT